MFIPVVDKNQKSLMPTTPARARKWMKSGKATGFWKKGIFCVRLNIDPSDDKIQNIWIGIDPGSKKEGFTVKSEAHTYLNIQADAKTNVKDKMETRCMMRRNRRQRKTPCRAPRWNRSSLRKDKVPPSTKARWDWKLRIVKWLNTLYPIHAIIIEDIKATSNNGKKWNSSFSPLQVGKDYFRECISKLGLEYYTIEGWETADLRRIHGLKKSKDKMSKDFSAHCVDSWVIANSMTKGHTKPDNIKILYISPINVIRRQLHKLQCAKDGIRIRQGGTMSLGLKKSSLVRHKKYGVAYVGGYMNNRISIHDIKTGKRLYQNIKSEDCKFLSYNMWKMK